MVDIWLGFAFLCFVLFLYIKVRKAALAFFNDQVVKVRRDFSELESLKQEIEILKQEAIRNVNDLPRKKDSLLKEAQKAAENIISKKKEDLKLLRDSKIAAIQNSLELSYKRKIAHIQKDLLQITHQILVEKFVKAQTEQDSISEICQVLEKKLQE